MRLTLRTLLAYLDDTLEPGQAKLIGQKIAESDTAQELMARIKQVTRRRRLTSPPASGPGAKLDPNTIAEYLDNELPGDQQTVVEETCLESDLHLAEVAACHQILALSGGEPALVPPVARQRMYGLITGREAIPYRKPPSPKPPRVRDEAREAAADEADETLLLGLPLFRRYGTKVRWLVPVAAVLLLLGSAFALRMALHSGPGTVPMVAPASDQQFAQIPPAPLVETKGQPEAKTPEPKTQPEPKTESSEVKPAPTPEVKTPPEPKAPAEAKAEPETKTVPQPEPVPPAKAPVQVQSNDPSTERKEIGKYVMPIMAQPTVLLQQQEGKDGQWVARPTGRPCFNDGLSSQSPRLSERASSRHGRQPAPLGRPARAFPDPTTGVRRKALRQSQNRPRFPAGSRPGSGDEPQKRPSPRARPVPRSILRRNPSGQPNGSGDDPLRLLYPRGDVSEGTSQRRLARWFRAVRLQRSSARAVP